MNMLDISANVDVHKDRRDLTFISYEVPDYCSACAIAFIPTEKSILFFSISQLGD